MARESVASEVNETTAPVMPGSVAPGGRPPLLEVKNLKKHFPVTKGLILMQDHRPR